MKKTSILISVLFSSFLIASCGGGSSGSSGGGSASTSKTPDTPAPTAPSNLTATASSGTVSLSWDSVAGASYKVYRSTRPITDNLLDYMSYNVAGTLIEITGLTNGVTYYFVVTAMIGDKESLASNVASGFPEFPLPSTPTNLMASASSGTVNLSWTGSDGAHYYRVYQSTATPFSDDLSSYSSYNVRQSSREITDLTNNTTYYFVVTAVIGDKESGVSNVASGLPEFPLPSTPTNLRATPSSGTVNLSWTGSAGASYKVYQSTATIIANDLSNYSSYNVRESAIEITGLMNGTRYYFVVTAMIGDKKSGISGEVSGFPEENLIAPPTNLRVTASSGTVNLNWKGRDRATYKVHQATSSFGDDVADYENLAVGYSSIHVTATSTEITGLTNGTTYYFVVTALIDDKESGASNEVIGLPDFPIPSVPTSLTVTNASSGTVNLSWNSVAGASYKVYQATERFANDLSGHISYDVTETSIKISGLTNGTRYYFVVTALENGKESPVSNEVDGLPDFPIPPAPTNLMASASSGTVNLSWTGSAGAHYYKVYQLTVMPFNDDLSNYQSYEANTSSIEIPGLTNGTTYYFVVRAVIGDKESGVSNVASGLPEFPLPSTPTNLKATPSSGTVNLSWIGSDGASYKVYQSTATIIANDLSSYTSYNITASSIEITGLTNGTTYYFVVMAVIRDKESGVSNEVSGLPEENLIAPPTNLKVTASSGTVNLNWTGREGATYTVHQAEQTFGGFAVADYETLAGYSSIHVTATSTEIIGLTNGVSYYFVVTALIDDKESGASNEVIGKPDFPIPSAPTSLTVTSASSGTVNLSWNGVAGATYKVYKAIKRFGDDLSDQISYDVTETSTAITWLTNGTRYYFVVTALANGKESLASDEIDGLPDFPIPSTPTNLTVTNASSGTVNLSWDSVVGATYKVYQSTATIGDDLSNYTSHNVRESSIEITGLTNNTSYYFVVTAVIGDKESGASNEASELPEFSVPSTPTNLEVTNASSGTVNLSWTGSDGAIYKVYQSTGPIANDLSSYTSYNVSTSSTAITGLTNGTSYYFVVTALANGKESAASNEAIGLPDFPIPAPPTGLVVANASSGTVNLSWNSVDVAGATYKVYQSTAMIIADDLSSYSSYNVTITSKEITGLTNGTTYYFVVTALVNGKESPASEWVNGLPDFPLPSTPTNLIVTGVSSGTVNLSWDSVVGASYKVYQSTASIANDLSSYTSYNVTITSKEITGLTNGTTYYFVVTVLVNGKESPASNEVIGFPEFPIPSTPTNLMVTSVSSGTVNLSWDSVAGATYKVYQSTTSIANNLLGHISYDVTETSTKITGLTNNTSYYFVVTALVNGKESLASDEVDGFPEFPVPSTPTSLTVTSESSGTVNLSWTGSDGATYKVHQAKNSFDGVDDYEALEDYTSRNVSTSSIEISDLTNGETYYFVVTALANGKVSPASEWVSALPDFPIPSAPTSLTVTSASSGTVNLSWNSVAGASYTVYRSIGPIANDLSTSQPYETTRNSIAITGLINNTRYYFVVTALANGKESPASNEVNGLPEFPLPSTPTNLTASASSGTVNLSWTGSEGVHYYKVYQSTATIIADDLSSYSSYNVRESSRAILGLTNNTTYYFVVVAVIGDKESGISDEISGLPEFPQPSTPTNLRATPSSGTVNLSWTGSVGAHYYKVYQSTGTIIADDLSSYSSYNVRANTIEIPRLANGTTYYFVVRAVIGDKESAISDEVSGLPEENLIAPPTNLMVTASSGTVSLNWTGREGATYTVHQAEQTFGVADYTTLEGYTSTHVTETSKEITGLTNGASYYFVVTALVGSKESGASNEVIGNPDFPIPSTPTNLIVSSASSGTVNLSWNSVAGASYNVYQATVQIDDDDLSSYTSYNVTTNSKEISGLTNGTRYYFVVTALENGKESPASNEVRVLPDSPIPETPTGLVVTSTSSGAVNLRWNSVAGATYKVYRSTATIGDDLSASIFHNATTSSIEITGLRNGTRYYFVVRALVNGKESLASNEVSGLPDFPIPAPPTGLEVTSVSSGTVNLRWNSVAGVSYKVYQSTVTSFSDDLSSYTSYNVRARSIGIPELINGVTYYFVVTALANGKESPVSDEVSGLPDFPIPLTPIDLEVTSVSSGTVNLSWNSVAGASYKVYQSTGSIGGDLSSYTSYNVRARSIGIPELINGVTYYFVVTALANGKESPASDEVSGLPDFPIPAPPTGLVVTNASSGTVNLSWNSVAGVSYKVYQSTGSIGDDLSSYSSYNVSTSLIEITGLTNGSTYYFVVTALANGKESLASDEVSGFPEFPQPSTPTNLRATPSSGKVNLSWIGSTGANYRVYQSTATPFSDDLSSYSSYNVRASSIEIPGLTNGTTYYFVVRAMIGDKKSGVSEEISGLPEENLLAPPTNLEVTASSGTVNLNWTGREGATYKVHQATSSFGDDVSDYATLTGYISYDVTETSTKITELTNGVTYYFVVTALVGDKESGASNEVIGLPDFPIPSTPTSLTVTSASSGTVNLSWNSVAGATSYKVYQSSELIGDDLAGYTSLHVTTTSAEITDLTNGSSYYFVVTAFANGKESPASNEISGLPDFPIPATPTGFVVTGVSSGTVNLSWDSVAGATYKVYQSTATIGDDLSSYTSYNVTTTSTEITGLTNGSSYYFVVTALANGKESLASDEVDGLPDFPIPATPTGFVVTGVSSGTVNLSWDSVAGATYKVYQSTATIGDDLSSYTSYNVTTTSTEITGLTNGSSYYFVVTALANGKESLASDEVDGLPDFPIPLVPTSLTVTNASSGTVNLSWNSVAGASYKVYQSTRSIGDDLSSYTSYNVTTTSTAITELTNGTSYYFVVTALANGKESPASDEVDGLPDFPIPATPTSLVASASSGTVNLSWNSVAGASYRVYQSTATIMVDDLSSYTTYNVSTSSTEIPELTNGTRYYFVVTALANGKESPASDEVNGLPDFPIPLVPTSLTVTSISSGTVNLSWNSVAGASYRVYQSTATIIVDDLSSYTSYNVSTSSTEIPELTNGTRYYFVVTALANGKESGVSSEVDALPDFPIPATPTELVVVSVSSGTVNLSWNSVAGATYKVYQSTATIGDDLSSYTYYNVMTTSKEITELTNGTSYYFVVTALANGKESPASNEVDGLPDFPIPATPTSLTVTNESSGTVNLSWNSVAGATYKVYQSTATIGDDLSSYTSYNATTISKVITDLTNGSRYYFVVTALANGKESPASDEVNGLPDFPIPEAPTSLTVTNESSGTVNLSWDSVAGATYKVYQSTRSIGDDLSSYTSYNATTISKVITDLTNGTRYYFVVTALANGKESPASDEVNGLPDFPIPEAPTSLTVTNESSGTVNLSWNSVAGASYKVYQSTATIGDDLSSYTSYNATTISKVITDLTNGTRYYFVVTALANGKESPASEWASGLPDFPIPEAPTSLTVTNESSGTVNLSWNSVAGATYRVYQSTATIGDDLSSYTFYSVSTIPIEIIGLTNGTSYYFVVTALANGKESPASNEAIGLPDFPIPATPTGLVVASVSSGTVNLSWNSVAGATYKVYQSSATIGDDLSSYTSYNAAATSKEITGLTNGTSYYFVVTALANGKESSASDEVNALPDFPIPATPTNLRATPSSGTVNLSWNSVAGATYKVYQSSATIGDDLSSYTSYNVSTIPIEIIGLTNGTSYYFVVTALANGKESPASNEAIGLPDFPIPATPTNLRATPSSGTVNLSWNSVVGATYKVYQSTGTIIADDLSSYTSYNVSTSSKVITDLTNGTRYYFVVTALANGKESPASDEVDGLPDFPIPATPTNLRATPSSGTVNLSWNSVVGATYKVYQSTGTIIADDLSSYTSYNAVATSKEITDLTNGTRYYFVVTALANGKESLASNEVDGLPDFPIPPAPTSLTVTSVSSGTVNLSWNSVAGATSYKVHQATEVFGSMVQLNYEILSDYQSTEVNTTSSKITGLTNDISYYFVITALANGKESLVSNEVSSTPVSASNSLKYPLVIGTGKILTVSYHPDVNTKKFVAGTDAGLVLLYSYIDTGTITLEQNFTGHGGIVNSVAFSTDGSKVVSGGDDNTIRLWDVNTGSQIGSPLTGHTDDVNSVAFSSDGSIIVSGSDDNTIRLWDVSDVSSPSQIGSPLTGHTDDVNSVAFSPDGSTIVSGSVDKKIILWDVSDVDAVSQIGSPLTGHTDDVNSVAFSADGSKIVSGSDDIRVWNVNTGSQIGSRLTGHTDDVNSVAFSSDGSIIVSGSDDHTVRLWDIDSKRQIGKSISGSSIRSVAFSPDGSKIISGSDDQTVRLWNINTGNILGSHTNDVKSVVFSPDGSKIASGSRDYTVILWDVNTRSQIGSPLTGHTDWVTSVAFSSDGSTIVSGGYDKTIRLWDVSDVSSPSQIGSPLRGHTEKINSVAFSPDGSTIVSGSVDKKIILWDVSDVSSPSQIGSPLTGHTGSVNSVAFSPDGSKIVSGGDNTIRLWDVSDVSSPSQIGSLGHESVRTVAFSPDGSKIVSGGGDTIILWDVSDVSSPREIGGPINGHGTEVLSVAFSPDGSKIVSSGDALIKLWDVSDDTLSPIPIRELAGHIEWVFSVAFSPDGSKIVSGGSQFAAIDNTVRLWDINAESQIVSGSIGHKDIVNSVAFSPDESKIISGGDDDTVRLWDVNTGSQISEYELEVLPSDVLSVAFSPDGSKIISGDSGYYVGSIMESGFIRLWDLASGDQMPLYFVGGHDHGVNSVFFSPDGSKVVSGGSDNLIRLWDISGNRISDPLSGHTEKINSVAFSTDGSKIVSGSDDDTIILWDISDVNAVSQISSFTGHTSNVTSVAFNPDGSKIVSGSVDKTIRLWSVSRGSQIGSNLIGHTGDVNSVAFSPDGSKIVSGGDITIRLWGVTTGSQIGSTLTGHGGIVNSVAFSASGSKIVSGSADQTIRIWLVNE